MSVKMLMPMVRGTTRFEGDEEDVVERGQWMNLDDCDKADFESVRRGDWQANPLLNLKWAILEQWVWDFLQGVKNSEIDPEAMRELVEYFPSLPVDLPERLLALTSEEKRMICANRARMGNRRGGSSRHGPGRTVRVGAVSQKGRIYG